MESFLLFFSIVALATLAGITYILAQRRNVALFITVGQDVFAWCSGLLAVVLITRLGTTFQLITSTPAKFANSISFIVTVVGITYSVVKHGKRHQ